MIFTLHKAQGGLAPPRGMRLTGEDRSRMQTVRLGVSLELFAVQQPNVNQRRAAPVQLLEERAAVPKPGAPVGCGII